jgi:5-methylcytosine-specific restriction endonuclease McrA
MRKSFGKKPPLRVAADAYRKLRRQILQRDGWRCQNCGSLRQLEVHHLQPRGRSGEDREENLVTLCAACHRQGHEHPGTPLGHRRA